MLEIFFLQCRGLLFWLAIVFAIGCGATFVLSLVRGGLLVARYSDHGKSCKPDNSSNLTAFKLFQQPQKAGYVFYMFLCAVSMLLHSMEYVLLAQGTVKFIQSYKHIGSYLFKISRGTSWKWEFLGPIVLMLPVLLLACTTSLCSTFRIVICFKPGWVSQT